MILDPEECFANLALIWPQARWRPVLASLMACAQEGPAEFTRGDGVDELVDAAHLAEIGFLSGWAQLRDLPVGFTSLASDLLSRERLSADRPPSPLSTMALFRLKGSLLAKSGLTREGVIRSRSEAHLRCYEDWVDEIRTLLFDSEFRLGIKLALELRSARRALSDRAPGNSPTAERAEGARSPLDAERLILLSSWRLLEVVVRLLPLLKELSSRGTYTDQLLASSYWHLFAHWLAGLDSGVLQASETRVAASSSMVHAFGRSRDLKTKLADRPFSLDDLRSARAAIAGGTELFAPPAAEYAARLAATHPWL